jgi:PAS domain S-box-containing protein
MQPAPIPDNERARLKSLRELDVMTGGPAGVLDRIASLAARCFRAPIATVTLVDELQECYVGAHGVDPGVSDRRSSFCGWVVLEGGLLVVPDTAADERFRDNPRVKELGIRSYLGAAIVSPDGHKVGALCVKDTRPRFFGEEDVEAVRMLAGMVSREFAMRDISRRAEAAQARAQESEARFRRLADDAPMMVWTADPGGALDYFNRSWSEFTGRPMEADLGSGWAELVHPEDRGRCLQVYGEAVAAGRPHRMRYRLRRHDGAYRWIEDHGGPRHGPDGALLGFIGTCLDVDDLVRTQEELSRARDAAEAASRAKSDFLTVMSHEIRTPLTAILGYTDLLEDTGDVARAPLERLDYLATIRRNGVHLLSLVTDLLDLVALEKGQLEARVAVFDASVVLREALEAAGDAARRKGLSFGVELPERALMRSDPEILRRVVRHLAHNAVKFTALGSVAVRAWVEAAGPRPALMVEVRDTGIGMTPEQQREAFEPFGKADTSMSRRAGGTGVGLPLCRRLATVVGGELTVESEVGNGSVFTLRVPSRPEPAGAAGDGGGPLQGVRVLVAEDGPDNQRLIRAFLRRAGAEVEVAENGERAVEVFRAWRAEGRGFDLVLMDMQMPVKDGYAATAELKAGGAGVPIVAVTAHARVEDRDRCLAAGCDEFLTKPIDRAGLVAMCRRLVRRSAEPA